MKKNANITIYNKYIASRADVYQRKTLAGTSGYAVLWENRHAANVLASGGQISADVASVFIPFSLNSGYLQPKAWQALTTKTGKWTLQVGDVIVKGSVTDTISSSFTITALKAKYDDVLVISSVDYVDEGSVHMHHWQIGAK